MKFDYRSITDTIQRSLSEAGLGREAGLMEGITSTINQSLATAGLTPGAPPPVFEGKAPERREEANSGEFLDASFTNAAGTRSYKLYVPGRQAREDAAPAPLVVMLHGCKQSPDDFARGTRMNELAERNGFLVAYPAQTESRNGSNCWNWFHREDQARDRGEPSILAGIVDEITLRHRVDSRRVYVAGMSAGAAMAVILAATYPERFAAVAAHSGLPYGSAHDLPSALAAMKNGSRSSDADSFALPIIVFHGDRDMTVNVRNAASIVEQATFAQSAIQAHVHEGQSADGRSYRRTVYADAAGRTVAEQWVVSGAGHAWCGGDPSGSFTDARGPNASEEIVRFLLSVQGAVVA